MLIITRKIGEVLRIGDAIQVTVLEVKGSQVRLGIDAPKDVPVHREEVLERIKGGVNRPQIDGNGIEPLIIGSQQ